VRRDFPILHSRVHGRPLVYLDNAATTHKPQPVIDAISAFYEKHNSNVHRGVHWLSQRATQDYEHARTNLQHFLNAASPGEIIFVRGTTEAINLVAHGLGRSTLLPGDEVLVTEMEHHSGIVPWQMACQSTGAKLRVLPMDDRGVLRSISSTSW
jgi:cysteine desulfurase/selenocysteine lyase